MGTIIKRRRKNGTVAWLAQISVMRQGKVLLRESQTFERRSTAAAWIENREETLARPGTLDALKTQPKSKKTPTLADAIDRYVRESNKQIGRTKTQVLKSIKTFDIADMHCDAITSTDIVAFAQEKLDTGVQPQTVSNYMSHLAAVFSIARPAWGYPLNQQAMEDARKVSDRLGITGKSRERDRRPTLDELDQLMQHFLDRSKRRPSSIPMHFQ